MREFRALWIPHWEMTSAQSIGAAVEQAVRARCNAVFVQVRARGDAYYQSDIAARAEGIADSRFDPLAAAIAAAREAGLQVHAWINALLLWTSPSAPANPHHILHTHPDWLMVDPDGAVQFPVLTGPDLSVEGGYFLDPGVPAVVDYLERIVRELVGRYPLEGLALDYIRHPNRVGRRATRLSYTPESLRRFREAFPGRDPAEWTPAWDQWREDQVTEVVRRTAAAIRLGPRPHVRVSAATLARWDLAQGRMFTSGRDWLAKGYLDFVCPMLYFTDLDSVVHYGGAWMEANQDRVYPVLGAHLNEGPALAEQIRVLRAAGCRGESVFASSNLDPEKLTHLRSAWRTPAEVPHLPVRSESPEPAGAIPRRPPLFRVGTLRGSGRFSRDFYARTGNTRLWVLENTGIGSIRVTVNREHTFVLGDGQVELDLAGAVNPAQTGVYTDNHTAALTIEGTGPASATAVFAIEDRYGAPGDGFLQQSGIATVTAAVARPVFTEPWGRGPTLGTLGAGRHAPYFTATGDLWWLKVTLPDGREGWLENEPAAVRLTEPDLSLLTLVLDPGHGGIETGAVANGVAEKHVNLAIALRVRDLLAADADPAKRPARIWMTRTDDSDVSLLYRSRLANAAGSRLFLSIHNNAFDAASRGTETYWKCGAEAPAAIQANSRRLACLVQQRVLEAIAAHGSGSCPPVDRGVICRLRSQQDPVSLYSVLNRTETVAALVECVFISHAGEAACLKEHTFLDRLAAGIRSGLHDYLFTDRPGTACTFRTFYGL